MCGVLGLTFELGLRPPNALLAVPQCPLVIASPVISSLLTAFRGLVAVSAHVDEQCLSESLCTASCLTGPVHGLSCEWWISFQNSAQSFSLHRVFFAQNIDLISESFVI